MTFERPADALCRISAMHVVGDKLELNSPLFSHPSLVVLAALVVKDLEIHCESPLLETLYDCVIDHHVVPVFSRLEGLDKDHV